MNTKEKILVEALKLFSLRGYSDVYLNEIADKVGIKAPSLYKHFKNKQDIFDNCIEIFYERMNDKRQHLLLPKESNNYQSYLIKNREEIINIALELFNFYLLDDIASNFRTMLLVERFKDEKLNNLYETIFIEEPINYQAQIFNELMKAQKFKEVNPKVLAHLFYSPIYFLLQKYDSKKHRIEEAQNELIGLLEAFCNTWEI